MATSQRRDSLLHQLRIVLSELGIDEDEMTQAKSVMQDVTQRVLNGLQQEHSFIKKFEFTGSAYEGSKIMSANEFDVMVIFDGNLGDGLVRNMLTPGYVSLQPRNQSADVYRRFLQEHRSTDGQTYLDPEMARRAFFGLVQKQINKLGIRNVVVSLHGPAVMLTINGNIDVDLVLAFSVNEGRNRYSVDDDLFVAKPFKDYAEEKVYQINFVPISLLWRQSFSLKEKEKLRGIDMGQGCRRQCLKILKWIRERDTTLGKLTSYHFKTLLFHECARLTSSWDWTNDKLAERFTGLLRSLFDCLQRRCLQHYFVSTLNLLDGIREITIRNMEGRIKTLINSDQARTELLSRRSTAYRNIPECLETTTTPTTDDAGGRWCTVQ